MDCEDGAHRASWISCIVCFAIYCCVTIAFFGLFFGIVVKANSDIEERHSNW